MAKKIDRRCGTCAHLRIEGFARVYKNSVYECGWKAPAEIALPDSITKSAFYSGENIRRQYMAPTYGTTCPTWEPRKAAKEQA